MFLFPKALQFDVCGHGTEMVARSVVMDRECIMT